MNITGLRDNFGMNIYFDAKTGPNKFSKMFSVAKKKCGSSERSGSREVLDSMAFCVATCILKE